MTARAALIIGYVWPEPLSSAAGVRTTQVARALSCAGWRVVFSSPSGPNGAMEALEREGYPCASIQANDPGFDAFVRGLEPEIVVFDRFVIEEQFSWRVRAQAPSALRVVDTQDLHFLRRSREAAISRGVELERVFSGDIAWESEDACRELASVHRSDLSWVVSEEERGILLGMGVESRKIEVSRFVYPLQGPGLSFKDRDGFVMIGNFRHPPNLDGVEWLVRSIWPMLRRDIPDARLDLIGAYPPREIVDLGGKIPGLRVRGWVEDSTEALGTYRVCLAPLRFGAGLKGKILEGWSAGTPAVTTPIGAEGLAGGLPFGGIVARTEGELANAAIRLHEDAEAWDSASRGGSRILNERFDPRREAERITRSVEEAITTLEARRAGDWTGSSFWHQTLRSTEYFSRWIEAKGSLKNPKHRLKSAGRPGFSI